MVKMSKNNEGVSAVIGVILMVAITVILAAVIAAFVFSMSNNIGTSYTVAFTVKKTAEGGIIVTNNGGADVGKMSTISVSIAPNTGANANTVYSVMADDAATLVPVGASKTFVAGGTYTPDSLPADLGTGTCHVIVTGKFKDTTSQVLIMADV